MSGMGSGGGAFNGWPRGYSTLVVTLLLGHALGTAMAAGKRSERAEVSAGCCIHDTRHGVVRENMCGGVAAPARGHSVFAYCRQLLRWYARFLRL